MKQIYTSSVKNYEDISHLPIIAAIYELEKGEFPNEKKKNEQKVIKQAVYENSK